MSFKALQAGAVLVVLLLSYGCGDSAKSRSEGVEQLDAIEKRWTDGVKIADSTSRIALSGPAMNLQQIRRDLEAVHVSECLVDAKGVLAGGMDTKIAGVLAFMSDGESAQGQALAAAGALTSDFALTAYAAARQLCQMSESDAASEVARRSAEAAEAKVRAEKEAAAAAERAITLVGEMVTIPAGSFLMGSNNADESPQHRVTIGRAFALGKYEVTFDAYAAFATTTGRELPDDSGWGRGNRPVINVSWNDAVAYAAWMSEQSGKKYRLPTESEWEYAARAGTSTEYDWGNDVGRNRANCDGCGSQWDNKQTAPVGSFTANAFGLHDMHGNVWEWVRDCYHEDYRGAPADGTSREICGTESRVLRGGSWDDAPYWMRSAYRTRHTAPIAYTNYGFRLAQDLE